MGVKSCRRCVPSTGTNSPRQGRGGQPAAGAKTNELAVWAEAPRAGGRTLHRLGLEGADRDLLLTRADSLLARYLDASGGCGDAKLLGKVRG
ncbi:hypothetical protein [Streptomyces sp. c-19]|uniref:hypothetical protein n=1 Tax=Streptomyces sp. c-19 TaxID=2789275 RepID=UPI0039805233